METTGNSLAVDGRSVLGRSRTRIPNGWARRMTCRRPSHVAILDAIENGDPALLRAAIRAHYAPVRERMTGQLPSPAWPMRPVS